MNLAVAGEKVTRQRIAGNREQVRRAEKLEPGAELRRHCVEESNYRCQGEALAKAAQAPTGNEKGPGVTPVPFRA